MLKVLIFCFAIGPISYGSPVSKIGGKSNSTIPVVNKILQSNETKVPVVSEGGAIIPNMLALSLPKENQAFLMTSPADISSNKVKPRKGAPVEGSESISIEQSPISNVNQVQDIKSNATATVTKNDTKLLINASLSTPVPIIKKPPLVSVELIEKADLLNPDPAMDDEEERMIKIDKKSSNGHPEIITPIVITVLVLPIFAMVGYMALKRGQEAWKNRHYKRMDFLLDGMYND